MSQLVPVCPYLLEADPTSKILFSHRGVADSYPLHSHDFYEMELVFRGKGRQWLNNVCLPLEPGSLYILTLLDVHRLEADEPLHILSIHLPPDIAEQSDMARIHDAHAMQLSQNDFDLFFPLAYSVVTEKSSDLAYKNQKMLAVAMLLMVHLLRYGQKYGSTAAGKHLQQTLKFIHSNFTDPNLCLKDAADGCGLSPCHFSTTFHNAVGCGFSEYLTLYRIHSACLLLASQDVSVTEIAYEVGFSSLSHFFRTFKQVYHCTPKEYRNNYLAHSATELQTPLWDSTVIPAPQFG